MELRFTVSVSAPPLEVKARLAALAGSCLTADDVLTIDSRVFRAQRQNRETARRWLVELIAKAAVRPKRRTPTKPKKPAKEARIATKKKRSSVTALRRPSDSDD
ncbi:MAG: hypothetical protein Q7J25_07365 [Vicinamibacterales bacterium]|nr:hypothetical protein [Vicinamibacterales bacterium]